MNLTAHLLDLWLKASNLSRGQFIHQYSIPPLVSVPRLSGPMQPLFGVLYLLIFGLAVVGNAAVLTLLCKRRGLRQPSAIFIYSLAFSDLLIAIVCVPASLLQHFFTWLAGDVFCKLVPFLQVSAIAASILTMTCIAVERFQGILYPLHAFTGYFLCHACKMLVAVWLSALAIAAPMLFVQKVEEKYDFLYDVRHACCLEAWPGVRQRRVYTTCLFVLIFLVPMVTMGVLYGKMACELWGKHRVHDVMFRTLPGSEINKITRRKKRAVRMMATVVLLFAVCWAPFHTVSLLLDYGQLKMDLDSEFLLVNVVQILGFSNSVCNPLVYAALNAAFQRDLGTLLTRGRRAGARWWSGVSAPRRRWRATQVGVSAAESRGGGEEERGPAQRGGVRQWSSRAAWEPGSAAAAAVDPRPPPAKERRSESAAAASTKSAFSLQRLFSVGTQKMRGGTLLLSVTDPLQGGLAAAGGGGSSRTDLGGASRSTPSCF